LDDIAHSNLQDDYGIHVFPRIPKQNFPGRAQWKLGRNLFRIRRFLNFFHVARKGPYRIMHMQSADTTEFLGSTIFMVLANLAGLKVILHIQGCDWERFYPKTSLLRKLYTRVGLWIPDRTIVLYGVWVDEILKMYPKADVRIIKNLLHDQQPPAPEEVQSLRKQLQLSEDDFVVVSVGSVGWRKGTFEILKAAPQIIAQEDSVKFVLVGGESQPGEMARLRQIVAKEGLEKWVNLTGEVPRDQIPQYLALGDVYLLPSFIEGMPVAIIEAMRSGLPVISTRVQGIPDMMVNLESGILIDPGSPDQIAKSVLLLKRDEAFRRKIAAASRKTFEDVFEFSKGIEQIRQVYKELYPL
jgi:glycosyltransferase involved in cell wall biosynthesis